MRRIAIYASTRRRGYQLAMWCVRNEWRIVAISRSAVDLAALVEHGVMGRVAAVVWRPELSVIEDAGGILEIVRPTANETRHRRLAAELRRMADDGRIPPGDVQRLLLIAGIEDAGVPAQRGPHDRTGRVPGQSNVLPRARTSPRTGSA
jgi:hypothetical protein